MKNDAVARVQAANEAWEDFDRWFNRAGHWIYRDREHALSTWKRIGMDGLPVYPGERR